MGLRNPEFYLRNSTYVKLRISECSGALSLDKTFPERSEIDADQGVWIVGSSCFLSRIRSATDAELSRVFHE